MTSASVSNARSADQLAARPSPWLIGPGRDTMLIVGTPLLILPLTWLLLNLGAASTRIQYFVLAFGALGHNLPGMLRAYGDRALFQRFRTRFIVAPLVFLAICTTSAVYDSGAIVLLAYIWSVWHAMMQIYGFMRIYDAKAGSTQSLTARLDLALCAIWFAGAIAFSPSRFYFLSGMLTDYGIPALSVQGLSALRVVMGVLMAGVAIVHLGHRYSRAKAGLPANWVKDLLILSSLGSWWFAHIVIDDVILGLIMFEVFHDVQYLTIVWLFNCRRVDSGQGVGRFTGFIFRRSWGLLGVYVGMVLAYGGLAPLLNTIASSRDGEGVQFYGTILITTSALLHYYYDGFIWKIRESSTSSALSIARGKGREDLHVSTHALKWLLLLVPLGALAWSGSGRETLASTQSLAETCPDIAKAQWEWSLALNNAGRHEEAIPPLERCLELEPDHDQAPRALAISRLLVGKQYLQEGRDEEARDLLGQVLAHLPDATAHCTNNGLALWKGGKIEAAIAELRAAIILDPESRMAYLNLALVHRSQGSVDLALENARRGLELEPGDAKAQQLVAELEASK